MTVLNGLPDVGRRLSEGAVIHASVLGRVMGVRLLRLEATLVATPAASVAQPRPLLPALPSRAAPRARAVSAPNRVIGSSLGEALSFIDESAASLAAAKQAAPRAAARQRPG